MSQAPADLPKAAGSAPPPPQTEEDDQGTGNPDAELDALGISPEDMTSLPVDEPSAAARAAENILSGRPGPQEANGQQYQPPPSQPSQSPSQPQFQPQPPQQASQPQAPPQPQGIQGQFAPPAPAPPPLPPLANNYRLSAGGDPLKQLALHLMRENPDLMPAEAQAKAEERLGRRETPEEIDLRKQIEAKVAEADQAAEDMDAGRSRALDREAQALRDQLQEARTQRQQRAETEARFEAEVAETEDRVAQTYPDALVEGSPMRQQMQATEAAFRAHYGDERVDADPRIMDQIAAQAAQQLQAAGYTPGQTHLGGVPQGAPQQQQQQYYQQPQAPPPPPYYYQPQQPPGQVPPPPQPVYYQQPPTGTSPPGQPQSPVSPWAPQYAPQPQQQSYGPPPLATGDQRRGEAPADQGGMLDKINRIQSLEDYEDLVDELAG